MSRPLWTDQEIARAADLWREGYSASQIGEAVGRSRNSVIGLTNRLRARFPRKGRVGRSAGRPPVKVETAAPAAVSPAVPANAWTRERLADAARLWKAGVPVAEMATRLGRSADAIKQLVSKRRADFPTRQSVRAPVVKASGVKAAPAQPAAPSPSVPDAPRFAASAGYAATDLRRYALADVPAVAFGDLGAGQCRFPLEGFLDRSGPGTPCCGAATDEGRSYCAAHRIVMRRAA